MVSSSTYALVKLAVDLVLVSHNVKEFLALVLLIFPEQFVHPADQLVIVEALVHIGLGEVLEVHEHTVVQVNYFVSFIVLELRDLGELFVTDALVWAQLTFSAVGQNVFVVKLIVRLVVDNYLVLAGLQVASVHENFLLVLLHQFEQLVLRLIYYTTGEAALLLLAWARRLLIRRVGGVLIDFIFG